MNLARARFLSICLALTGALTGCAADAGTELDGPADLECRGKCDLLRDARNLDRYDLFNLAVGWATDELNDELAFRGVAAELDAPQLYALPETASGDLTLHDIDSVVTGLAARYGERELSTEVNRVRRDWLRTNPGGVWAEAGFSLRGTYDPKWRFDTGGFEEGWSQVGFHLGSSVDARVVAPFGSEPQATLRPMLQAIQETRSFVLPRGVDDVREMEPGEVVALHGAGSVGLSLGAGAPITLLEPTAGLTYNLVVSAGAAARLDGDVDIQLARLEGDEVVIDVGIEKARLLGFHLAAEDGWGVHGLVDSHVRVGGIEVDLGRVIEKALERELDAQLDLFGFRVGGSTVTQRLTIARFRIQLDEADQEVAEAMAQALKGDVRYAQALANAAHPGVAAEVDLVRAARTRTMHAGVHFLGMHFFRTREIDTGTVVIQTPDGARSVAFDSLYRQRGWFFSSHGYRRTALSGLTYDPADPMHPVGEANLLLEVIVEDDHFQRDKLLDQLDSVIVGMAGTSSLGVLEGYGNEVERILVGECNHLESFHARKECRLLTMNRSDVVALRREGIERFTETLAFLEPRSQELLGYVGRQRLATQAAGGIGASLDGPRGDFTVDLRIDDQSLDRLFLETSPAQLRAAVADIVRATDVDRTSGDLLGDRERRVERERRGLDAVAQGFERLQRSYRSIAETAEREVPGLGKLGQGAMVVRFPVDASNRPIYEEASIHSVAHVRAQVARDLFDLLEDAADTHGLGREAEQTAVYALLALLPDAQTDVEASLSIRWARGIRGELFWGDDDVYRAADYQSFSVRTRGSAVSLVSTGAFDIESLVR